MCQRSLVHWKYVAIDQVSFVCYTITSSKCVVWGGGLPPWTQRPTTWVLGCSPGLAKRSSELPKHQEITLRWGAGSAKPCLSEGNSFTGVCNCDNETAAAPRSTAGACRCEGCGGGGTSWSASSTRSIAPAQGTLVLLLTLGQRQKGTTIRCQIYCENMFNNGEHSVHDGHAGSPSPSSPPRVVSRR